MTDSQVRLALIQREIAVELRRCQLMGPKAIHEHLVRVFPGIGRERTKEALTGMVTSGDAVEEKLEGAGIMYRLTQTSAERSAVQRRRRREKPRAPQKLTQREVKRLIRDISTTSRKAYTTLQRSATTGSAESLREALRETISLLRVAHRALDEMNARGDA